MLILNNQEIKLKLTRIAYQIFENNINNGKINLIGVNSIGYFLAKEIYSILYNLFNFNVTVNYIEINKKNYEIKECDFLLEDLKDKNVIIVDDVLNTGKTLSYCISHILKMNLNSLKVAVLIDRNYKKFPVKCDYMCLSLYTSFSDNISVTLNEKDELSAFLN